MPRYDNRKLFRYDPYLGITIISLLLVGLLMVASASMVISDHRFHHPFHFIMRQCSYAITGLLFGWIITRIPLYVWEKASKLMLLSGLLLLLLVLIPGIGHLVNGSRRWLFIGSFGLQPSEWMKFSMIVYLADFLVRHNDEVRRRIWGFLKPMSLLCIVAILLLLEPDFGTTAVLTIVTLGMMFWAGVPWHRFLLLLLLAGSALTALVISSPYRLTRLTSFLHPWQHPFHSGYQLTQSLIAFGRGGVWGMGLGNGIQKLFYLPEAHTDFLFAVIAEEFGLLGSFALVIGFSFLVGRGLYWAWQASKYEEGFAAYVAYGISLWFALQAAINIGVNLGLLPTKGLTLPLISYGGSSLLISCIAMGLLLRVGHEMTVLKRQKPIASKNRSPRSAVKRRVY